MQIMSATQLDTFLKVLLNTKKFGNLQACMSMSDLLNESHFKILRKCQGVFKMLYVKKFKPTGNLNVQIDSILAKLFV